MSRRLPRRVLVLPTATVLVYLLPLPLSASVKTGAGSSQAPPRLKARFIRALAGTIQAMQLALALLLLHKLAALSMLPTRSPTLRVLFRQLTYLSVAHGHPVSHLASLDIPRALRRAPRLPHTIFRATRLWRIIFSTRMSHALVGARYAPRVHHRELLELVPQKLVAMRENVVVTFHRIGYCCAQLAKQIIDSVETHS